MTPLDQIKDWLNQQPEEVQDWIAFHVLRYQSSLESAEDGNRIQNLQAWLTINDPNAIWVLHTGKVLAFRATLDYLASSMAGKSMVKDEAHFRQVLEEDERNPDPNKAGAVRTAKQFLERLPAHRESLERIAQEWHKFSDANLNDEKLKEWSVIASAKQSRT